MRQIRPLSRYRDCCAILKSTVLRPSLVLFSLLAGNACSYDTQTVLEMLFDIDTDNGINNNRISATQITIVVVVIFARTSIEGTRIQI